MKLFDSHCHLTDEPLKSDLKMVLDRAATAGVGGVLVPGYDLSSSRQACRLAASQKNIYAAIGLHPGWLYPEVGFSPEPFRQLARLRAPAAIGEIGLDYALENHSPDLQEKVLRGQLELAALLGLPVVIHCRRAFEPLYLVLKDYPEVAGVIHAYGGGPRLAERFLELGYYLGFGGGLTRPNAKKVRQTALLTPPERILLETDAPYIGTHTIPKGETEPCHAFSVAGALAELREWDFEFVVELTTANACRLFRLPDAGEVLSEDVDVRK
jgi:TatD DNase family protein